MNIYKLFRFSERKVREFILNTWTFSGLHLHVIQVIFLPDFTLLFWTCLAKYCLLSIQKDLFLNCYLALYGNSKFLSYLMFYNFKIQCVFFQIGSKLSMRGYIISHNDIHYVCNIISFCSWKFLINLLFESQYSILDSIFVLVKDKNLQCNIEYLN